MLHRPRVEARHPAHLPGRYGYYWWTNGADSTGRRLWPAAPERTFAMQGHLNNYCFVIPPWRMVVVRLGMDAVIDSRLYDAFFAALRRAFVGDP